MHTEEDVYCFLHTEGDRIMAVTTHHQLRHHSLLEFELVIIFRENMFAKFWTYEQPCCSNNNQSKLTSRLFGTSLAGKPALCRRTKYILSCNNSIYNPLK
jgi:hypothetical protein